MVLPLFRFTRDLFESITSEAPVEPWGLAIDSVAKKPSTAAPPSASLPPVIEFRHPLANREASLHEARVAFVLKRGKRRTIGFSVRPEGLVVSAPQWVPLHQIEAALREKSAWIVRKLAESRERQRRVQSSQIEWRDGASLPFLGEPVQLVLDPRHDFGAFGADLKLSTHGQRLHLALATEASAEQIRDAVQAWLMRQARGLFAQRLDHFAPQLQVQWRKLSLSSADTRWGSARVDGSIRLNWRLIHFRPAVIDYVVVHELSHLRVMDHSPRFWDTVRSIVPDYAQLRGQLRDETTPRW